MFIDGKEFKENPAGGENKNPVDKPDAMVEVVFRRKVKGKHTTAISEANTWYWYNTGKEDCDIIAYREV